MAGTDSDVIARDPESWAIRPTELARDIADQLEPDAVEFKVLWQWTASRWAGPVLLDEATLGRWIDDWRTATTVNP